MLPQVWWLQVVVAVLTQVAGDGTKTRMTLNGHAAAQEWQTECANVGEDFADKRIIKRQEPWELENQKSLHQ